MENGFDKSGFMEYLAETFNGFENCFLRGVVENIIDYGLKHERVSKDQFCSWVSDMLPEVKFAEVALFISDASLTDWGREQKKSKREELSINA